jgi:hypothetical protein
MSDELENIIAVTKTKEWYWYKIRDVEVSDNIVEVSDRTYQILKQYATKPKYTKEETDDIQLILWQIVNANYNLFQKLLINILENV